MNTKISEYINLDRIEFIVTYQCSGKCRHCSVADKLNQTGSSRHVKIPEAVNAIGRLTQAFPVTSVMTFGGEPLLYPDVVSAIHEKAKDCGISARQLITNGYFSNSAEKSRNVAEELASAGVNDLLLSVDAFHQETIPAERVYQFASDALNAGIPKIRLHPAWVVNQEHDNSYNADTKAILAKFGGLGIPISSGNNIFMAGNAVEYLREYYPKPELNLNDTCGMMPYTDPLTNITSVSIVPNGDVMICGFVIGNIYSEDILDVISRYNPYENESMRAVMSGGAAILAYAKEQGIDIDASQYYSVCGICHEVTKRLSNVM